MNCPVCQKNNTVLNVQTTDWYHKKNTQIYDFYLCKDCHVLFLDTTDLKDDSAGYIDTEYWDRTESAASNSIIDLLNNIVFQIMNHEMISLIKKNVRKGVEVLDVGSGSGQMCSYLNAKGYSVTGVEPDRAACLSAKTFHPNIEFHNKTLEKCEFESNRFDAIIMTHVLEHIEDLSGFLQECQRILKKNGVMILEVPAFSTIQFKLFKSKYFNLYPPKHFYLFSPYSIRKIFKRNGFITKKIVNFSFRSSPPCLMCSLFPFFNPVEIGKRSIFIRCFLSLCAYIMSFFLIPAIAVEYFFGSSAAFYAVFKQKEN